MNEEIFYDMDELLLVGDDSLCQYCGLPSVSSYVEEDKEVFMGTS